MSYTYLVIVESPAKAKTIGKYLGPDYLVLPSFGHVRDLIKKSGAVDPKNNFAMRYEIVEKNAKHVDEIVKSIKKADTLYLATDPDREGEAIAWALTEILKDRKVLKRQTVHRVVFHEITKKAISEALSHPRDIDMDLVNAQQARRALDYLVGYTLSPLLWKKIRRGLSAGRVQSPALRMICEREEAIENFKTQEYWSLIAENQKGDHPFPARLTVYNNEKLEQFSISDGEQAEAIRTHLLSLAEGQLTVNQVEKKQRKRQPAPPFITSTLQQEAGRKLGFTAQKTMKAAQQLYEGIDIGQGAVGLITYMRTDSVHLANEAIEEIRGFISQRYGNDYLPDEARIYKTKSKNAQEAHEAIRPTAIQRTPEQVKSYLNSEQFKLYSLIWKRTLASQMTVAVFDTVSVDLIPQTPLHHFRANGSVMKHPGFISVYQEDKDDSPSDEEGEMSLPPLTVGDKVNLKAIQANQHFTEPPPRYSEASLIKAMEECGIGRPSTYASIISTLQQREYALLDKKRFMPTDVGRIVNRFLVGHFQHYVDYDFTAKLEDELDEVSRGEKQWIPLLGAFWQPFHQQIQSVDETVQRSEVTQEKLDENCPDCQKPLSIRLGKRGRFIGCSGYPECRYTRNIEGDTESNESAAPVLIEGRVCPQCESPLQKRKGRYGDFVGCSNYPQCKYIESLNKAVDTGVSCPQCKEGSLVQKKSRYGKIFYSCNRYPDCQYAIWNEPVNQPCPKCHWPILTLKITKRRGTEHCCPQKECGFVTVIEPPNASSS